MTDTRKLLELAADCAENWDDEDVEMYLKRYYRSCRDYKIMPDPYGAYVVLDLITGLRP